MRGNGTNCIRIIPYSAVQFGSYNFYKKVSPKLISLPVPCDHFDMVCIVLPPFLRHGLPVAKFLFKFAEPSPSGDLSPMRRLVCGGAAGITSVTITYPLDIVRTRLSVQSASFTALGRREAGEALPGMFRTMVLIYKNEGGVIALYRGIIPTVTGVAPYVSAETGCLIVFD